MPEKVDAIILKYKFIIPVILIFLATMAGTKGIHDATSKPIDSMDFEWDKARILLDRNDPYQICISHQISETTKRKGFHDPTYQDPHFQDPHYFPSGYMLLWPYAAFPWTAAKYLWLASNLLFTFLSLFNVFKTFLGKRPLQVYLSICCLFLIGSPWRTVVGFGQQSIFCLCFFSYALRYLDTKPNLSGFFLALSFIKPQVMIPFSLYFLYKRQFRPLLIALAVHLGLHLFVSFWINVNPFTLIAEVLKLDSDMLSGGYLDFFAFFASSGLHVPSYLPFLLSVILLSAAAWICFLNRTTDDLLILSMLSFVAMTVVYNEITNYVFLIFPTLLLFKSFFKDQWFKILLILGIFLTWCPDRFRLAMVGGQHDAVFHTYDWVVAGTWFLTTFCCLVMVVRTMEVNPIARPWKF